MTKTRELAIKILDVFENMLADKNIKIPDEDRTGEEEEACLYGSAYYDLEDAIVNILDNHVEDDDKKIIRCKNCVKRETAECPMFRFNPNVGVFDYTHDDGYCDRGEEDN